MRWFHSFHATQPETGERRTFFIEYMIMNPALGGTKPILGQLPAHRRNGVRPSYLLMKAGVFPDAADWPAGTVSALQLHRYYPVSDLKLALNPLIIQFGENFYSEQHIYGRVEVSHQDARHKSRMTDEGCIEWDLEIHKAIACHTVRLADRFHNTVNALDSFWHAEGIQTYYRGHIVCNGTRYLVQTEDCYGYADKHWGKGFNSPWLQLASSHLISERTGKELKHSALAVEGCIPRFLCFPLRRKLILQLTLEGEDYQFNFTPFSRACKWKLSISRKRIVWQIVAGNRDAVVKIILSDLQKNMLPLLYENPDGIKTTALFGSGCGEGKIQFYRRTPEGKQLADTLLIKDALTIYERPSNTRQ